MARLNWTVEAARWLKDIHDDIAADDPAAAARVLQGIFGRAAILTEYPDTGHRYENAGERDIRVLLYGHYRIAYLIKTDEEIGVLGVFHGALELDRYLL